MTDQYGRKIDYMRVSITDRCNLRCQYCMPQGVQLVEHDDVLSYEELLHLCGIAASLGITKFKVTGGEPLARKGCSGFITRLKAMPGVDQVTLTTNGLLLHKYLDMLCAAGIDGINISLNTLRGDVYEEITGYSGDAVPTLLNILDSCVNRGLRVKVNAVLLARTFDTLHEVVQLAGVLPIDVRLIELMPIGEGAAMQGVPVEAALLRLLELWPDLRLTEEKRGNGPARYYTADGLQGCIGFIDAISHSFCANCNRVRLTGTGVIKPCLCYGQGTDLRELLRRNGSDRELRAAMESCIKEKPQAHCFSSLQGITEYRTMNRIGG